MSVSQLLSRDTAQAVTRLANAVLSVRPLVSELADPVRVIPGAAGGPAAASGPAAAGGLGAVLDRVAAEVGVPNLQVAPNLPAAELRVFERVVNDQLALGSYGSELAGLPAPALDEAGRIAAEVRTGGFERFRSGTDAVAADGTRLPVYAAGDRADRAVIISSACAMPVQLCERWLQALAGDHLVLTWQNRGLSGSAEDFDRSGYDALTQAADLIAVLDHYGVRQAHVMGFCTGSVIALAAAAAHPDRVGSLSLWHGAYELGPDGPKTSHHRHMQALMEMVSTSRSTAVGAYAVFCQSMLQNTPPGLAHLTLCPFATPERLYRYCRVNGAVTDTDVSGFLGRISQPALVVTSEDDDTAHPDASRAVAARLARATLQVEPHGDHLSLFAAGDRLERIAAGFLDATDPT